MTMTNNKIKRFLKRTILAGLITALAFINFACGTMPKDDRLRLRAGAGLGKSHVKGELKYAQKQHESDVGDVQGLRLEAARQCTTKGFENLALGLRVDLRGRQARIDDTETGSGDHVDLDAYSVDVMAVGRHYFPVTDDFRFYGEVAGGYAYNYGVLELNSAFHGQAKERGVDHYIAGSAGLGGELDLSDSSSVFLQLDYGLRFNKFDEIDFQTQDFMIFAGGEIRF